MATLVQLNSSIIANLRLLPVISEGIVRKNFGNLSRSERAGDVAPNDTYKDKIQMLKDVTTVA